MLGARWNSGAASNLPDYSCGEFRADFKRGIE